MDPIERLREMVKEKGVKATAEALKMSRQGVYNVLTGVSAMSETLSRKLGYEQIVTYRDDKRRKGSGK